MDASVHCNLRLIATADHHSGEAIMSLESSQKPQPATWRIVLAAILDFFTVFWIAGYAIARFSGGLSETGFKLEGGPAVLLLLVIVAYFVVFNRLLGGTIWKRILRAQR
jgi:hypothetical protein